jgi:pyrroline-5-carboxylate reductase
MKLGIIGCGNMGNAVAKGVLSKKILPFNNIFISDKDPAKIRPLYRKFGIRVATNKDIAKKCHFIIIAVKPQDSKNLFAAISKELNRSAHLISVMAGISTKRLASFTDKKIAITRAMPNMAAVAGKSITCLTHDKTAKEKTFVNRIFSSIGEVIEIEEKYMDAVTAISGSGLAYFFYLAECLKEAAAKIGINREKAARLAAATLVGSGALLDALDLPAEVLKGRIASRRGTTEAALHVLKSSSFKNSLIEAVKAAAQRSKELSRGA